MTTASRVHVLRSTGSDLFPVLTRLLEPQVAAAAPRGDRLHVVVKPNWIQQRNDRRDVWEALITAPVLVEQTVRAVAALTGGRSVISVCDAPHTNADFDAILERGSMRLRFDDIRREWPELRLEVIDLRREHWIEQEGVIVRREPNVPDPRGYTAVDLATGSCLYGHPGEGRYYGADYDRHVVNEHHQGRRHEYLLAGTPLDADLFINLPKLKTHRKTGITCALKNLVGINGDKNWLPHHTDGCPPDGGDERPSLGWRDLFEVRIKPLVQSATFAAPALAGGLYRFARRQRGVIDGGQPRIRNGNWQGNDTCWRMALDLNRALLYANRDGTFRTAAERKRYFCIVDAVIGGEGNGPTDPDPVASNVLIAGDDPAAIDAVGARLMNLAIERVPIVARAFDAHPLPIARCRLEDVICVDERAGGEIPVSAVAPAVEGGFRPHPAWPDARRGVAVGE